MDPVIAERKASLRAAKGLDELKVSEEELLEQAERRNRLESIFKRRAEGKPWYQGIHPHQWVGACYGAVARRWILGDGMGLGKTRQAIAWVDLISAQKVIVVCENGVVEQFQVEFEELAPHRNHIRLWGLTPDKRAAALDALMHTPEGVVFVNLEWFRDEKALYKLISWQADTLIVDEAHNLKTTSTGNFTNVAMTAFSHNTCPSCSKLIIGLSKPCRYCGWAKGDVVEHLERATPPEQTLATTSVKNVLLMTGTPILNSPDDLYALLRLIRPDIFANHADYRRKYLVRNQFSNRWEFRTGAPQRIKQLIDGAYLARTAEEVGIKLPDREIETVRLTLDPEKYPLQYRTIRQISERAHLMLSSGEEYTLMHVITVMLYKRMANSYPGGIQIKNKDTGEMILDVSTEVRESVKLDALVERAVAYWQKGERQVVFSHFRTALDELERRLVAQGLRVGRIDGSVPRSKRQRIKDDFYRAKLSGRTPEFDIVLAHYRTGGTGLNLTAATVTHILDEEWSPGKRDQAYGRTHRIGQTENTHVIRYIVKDTVDAYISNLHKTKQDTIDAFEGAMKSEKDMMIDFMKKLESGEIL